MRAHLRHAPLLAAAAILLAACHNPCEDDSDCFGSLVCIGSSVCPEGVDCVWEGEPGICGFPDQKACEISGGTWDPNSCGDYVCGGFPLCDAIIPGCDCGPHENFVVGVGCRPDPACRGECRWNSDCPRGFTCEGSSVCPPDVVCVWEGEPGVCEPTERFLCHHTEGRWDPLACGHYVCGDPNDCEAVIPGCDCGPGRSFVEGEGCVDDPECEPADEIALCEETGGTWDETACGHHRCESDVTCLAIIPGCDCGPTANFDPALGCVEVAQCLGR